MDIEELVSNSLFVSAKHIDLDKLIVLLEIGEIKRFKAGLCSESLFLEISRLGKGIYYIEALDSGKAGLLVFNGKITCIKSPIKINDMNDLQKLFDRMNKTCLIIINKVELPTLRFMKKYIFGIKAMDQNHVEMFGILNHILLSLIKGELDKVNYFISKLYDHTKNKHFRIEEELMKMTKYDKRRSEEYKVHLGWHMDFLNVIKDLRKYVEKHDYTSLLENLYMLFETYFERYLSETDRLLALYLKSLNIDLGRMKY